MSRINKDHVWEQYFGYTLMELCMCCQNVLIYRYAFSDPFLPKPNKRNWHKGHIIPARLTGPDIMENLNPICRECNEKDKKYKSNYHYRVKLKLMTKEEADIGVSYIWNAANKYIQNPELCECIAMKKNQNKCTNKRLPHTPLCGIHKKKEQSNLQKYVDFLISRNLNKFTELLSSIDPSDEDYHEILSMQKDLKSLASQ